MSGAMRAGSHTSDSSSALPMCSFKAVVSAGSVTVLPRNRKSPASGSTNTAGHSLALDSGSAPTKSGTRASQRVRASFVSFTRSTALVKGGHRVLNESPGRLAAHGDREQVLPGADVSADLVRVGEG